MNPRFVLRCIALGAAFLLSAPGGAIAAPANAAGKWSVSGSLGVGVVTYLSAVCTLRQNADTLAGSCSGANGGGASAGNVNGSRVFFQCRVLASNGLGVTGVIALHGTLVAANQLRGTWTISTRPGVTGTFTATRA